MRSIRDSITGRKGGGDYVLADYVVTDYVKTSPG